MILSVPDEGYSNLYDFERTWWRLFQNHIVCSGFGVYVFIFNAYYLVIIVEFFFRVKGIKRLRVADGSVMRSEASGNINAPIMMIGEKAADLIKGKDTVGQFRQKIASLKL